jgi:hypothetical protein
MGKEKIPYTQKAIIDPYFAIIYLLPPLQVQLRPHIQQHMHLDNLLTNSLV